MRLVGICKKLFEMRNLLYELHGIFSDFFGEVFGNYEIFVMNSK